VGYPVIVATPTSSHADHLPTSSRRAASPPGVGAGDSLCGTSVVSGVGYGPVVVARGGVSPAAVAAFGTGGFTGVEDALAAYDESVAAVAAAFTAKAARAVGPVAEVLTASAGLATDRGLRGAVRRNLRGDNPLLEAVHLAVEQFVGSFTQLGGVMAERVTDLRDIEARVVARLVGEPEPGMPTPAEPSVLVAEDLAPADAAGLDPRLVLALATERGGPTSHTAIIARQLGIPCVVGVTGLLTVEPGTRVLVDGTLGTVEVEPDPVRARARVLSAARVRTAHDGWSGPGRTADGVAVKILANVADAESAAGAAGAPVQGVGLFRTELCFLNQATEPSVAEQTAIYQRVLGAFGDGRHVVVRTLDAGSDKPLAFAGLRGEENPSLGVRGLRLSLGNPGLMDRQLDAIALAAAATGTETWVMAPMVATVSEAAEFGAMVRSRGLKAGVMVEVPSAALLADRMLQEVDFLSIGTNDLTQYTMAADRMAPELAHLTDPWQPAVLQLIATTAEAGRRTGKPVGVCGEAAADPLLACVLVGMGITSLSMAAAATGAVGAQLGSVTLAQCEAAAHAALDATGPAAGRAAVTTLLR
jgi:phosphotransferase system enzyme I (PtsI)